MVKKYSKSKQNILNFQMRIELKRKLKAEMKRKLKEKYPAMTFANII